MEDIENNTENQKLTLTEEAADYLLSTAKWSKFLAILGLIFTALIIILSFFAGAILKALGEYTGYTKMANGFLTVIYLFVGVLYIYPLIAMLKFSNFAILAVQQNSSEHLTESFRNLKGTYKFVGILTIIGLAFYAIIIFFAIIASIFI